MRIKNSYSVIAMVLIMVLVITACGSNNSNTPAASTSAPAASEAPASGGEGANKSPIRIGISVEKTGGGAEGGENIAQGVEIAVDIVNENGGVNGHPIELVLRDTEGNPTKGVSIIREFGNKEKVLATVGGYLSTVMLAQSPIIKEEKLPFVIATSNIPDGINKGFPYVFGVRMNSDITANYTLDFLKKHFNTDKIAILYEDGGYGQGALQSMTQALKDRGLKPTTTQSFNLNDKDMTAQVTKAKESGAEAIYLMGIGAANGYVIKGMERVGLDVPTFGESGATAAVFREVGGEAADGTFVIQTANYSDEQTREMAKEFLKRSEAKFGKYPTMASNSAQGFDAAMLLFKAIESIEITGNLAADREAVIKALENNAGPYEGVIRDWDKAFTSENHDAIDLNSYMMTEWKNGVLVKSELQ